jgi:hypothetical protein
MRAREVLSHCVCVPPVARSEFKSLDNARFSTERMVAADDVMYRDQRTSVTKRSVSGSPAGSASARSAQVTAAATRPAPPARLSKSVSARRPMEVRVPVLSILPPTVAEGGTEATAPHASMPSTLPRPAAASTSRAAGRVPGLPPRSLSQRPSQRRPISASSLAHAAAPRLKPPAIQAPTDTDSVSLPVVAGAAQRI